MSHKHSHSASYIPHNAKCIIMQNIHTYIHSYISTIHSHNYHPPAQLRCTRPTQVYTHSYVPTRISLSHLYLGNPPTHYHPRSHIQKHKNHPILILTQNWYKSPLKIPLSLYPYDFTPKSLRPHFYPSFLHKIGTHFGRKGLHVPHTAPRRGYLRVSLILLYILHPVIFTLMFLTLIFLTPIMFTPTSRLLLRSVHSNLSFITVLLALILRFSPYSNSPISPLTLIPFIKAPMPHLP